MAWRPMQEGIMNKSACYRPRQSPTTAHAQQQQPSPHPQMRYSTAPPITYNRAALSPGPLPKFVGDRDHLV